MNKILIVSILAALQFGFLLGLGVSFWWDYTHTPVPMMTQQDYLEIMKEE